MNCFMLSGAELEDDWFSVVDSIAFIQNFGLIVVRNERYDLLGIVINRLR